MSKIEDEDQVKDRDDETFLYAFDYFFHTNCDENTDSVCEKITQYIHDNPRYARIKANIINTPNPIPSKRKIFISDISQEFVNSLGSEVSREAIHLSMLFESLEVQGLFSAYDYILKYMNDSEYPQSSRLDDCSCYLSGSRKVKLIVPKGEQLGMTLDIDGATGQVFVSQLLENGAAYKSGCMKAGDLILEINEIDTLFKSMDELQELLVKNENGFVSFLIESCVEHSNEPYFVRSMMDFSVNSVSNASYQYAEELLNVNKGDLFEVIGSVDEEWLKAHFIGNTTLFNAMSALDLLDYSTSFGLIPKNIRREQNNNDDEPANGTSNYERLMIIEPSPSIVRCVLLIGPSNVGRNELKKSILKLFPDKYANVVPHTTRKPRKNEVDGVQYNFVNFLEMEKYIFEGDCIEHGEYNGNLYGTTYDSITHVMKQGKWPIINVNPKTIAKLRNATFKPLIVFVRPPDILTLKQTRSKPLSPNGLTLSSHYSDLEFKEMIASAGNIQRNHGEYFDFTIVNAVFDDALTELCSTLAEYENSRSFMPQKWVNWI